MNAWQQRGLVLLTALWLTACASGPTPSYYLLEAGTRTVSQSGGVSLGLHPIAIPEHLRRSALLVNASGGALKFSGQGRWGEPLTDGIRRVSALDLAAALGSGELRPWPWSGAQQPQIEVHINVLTLDRSRQQATLIADVAITDRRDNETVSEQFLRTWTTQPSGTSDAATAAAYSALIQKMNRDIAAAINAR